jgi:hypothetical protein
MCLHISYDQEQNEEDLQDFLGNRKNIFVYKVLIRRLYENFYRSFYRPEFEWDFRKQKIYQVDRPNKPTKDELYNSQIEKGLHVYTHLNMARYFREIHEGSETIAKFRVERKDIVAVNNGYHEAVCTKLTFIKVLEN